MGKVKSAPGTSGTRVSELISKSRKNKKIIIIKDCLEAGKDRQEGRKTFGLCKLLSCHQASTGRAIPPIFS